MINKNQAHNIIFYNPNAVVPMDYPANSKPISSFRAGAKQVFKKLSDVKNHSRKILVLMRSIGATEQIIYKKINDIFFEYD